jgi:calreticulin
MILTIFRLPKWWLCPCSKGQMQDFNGATPYSMMFGPDICGYSTQKVHAILADKKGRNVELKPFVKAKADQLMHVYTYILRPNNTYQVLQISPGSLIVLQED